MHFPTAWDPYFKPTMSVLDVYHFATEHFDHHRRQLTLRTRAMRDGRCARETAPSSDCPKCPFSRLGTVASFSEVSP